MIQSSKYKSPSTVIRNAKRMKTYNLNRSSLILPVKRDPKSCLTQLSTATTTFTNYPEPCSVCHKFQCQNDVQHTLVNTLSNSIFEAFENAFDKAYARHFKFIPDNIGASGNGSPHKNDQEKHHK